MDYLIRRLYKLILGEFYVSPEELNEDVRLKFKSYTIKDNLCIQIKPNFDLIKHIVSALIYNLNGEGINDTSVLYGSSLSVVGDEYWTRLSPTESRTETYERSKYLVIYELGDPKNQNDIDGLNYFVAKRLRCNKPNLLFFGTKQPDSVLTVANHHYFKVYNRLLITSQEDLKPGRG